jgi:hypothetical protein
MSEIYICCGLGDCLLYCQIYDLYRDSFKYKYVLNEKFVSIYKNDNITYCLFIKKIFNIFGVPLKIINVKCLDCEIEPNKLLIEYPLKQLSLLKYIPDMDINLPNEYIVINVNIRIVETQKINKNNIMLMIKTLIHILNTTKFNISIVIIGHRQTYIKNEVTNYSFFDKLILAKFIDKSYNGDLLNNPNIDNLLYDINILKNAKETFQFGFGGSLCLNIMFSNKLSCIVNPENDFIHEYFSDVFFGLNKNIKIYKCRNKLLERLNIYNILYKMPDIVSYDTLINILNKNGYKYINNNENNIDFIAVGIGDILFKLVNLQENLISKPVYINLDLFQSGCFKDDENSDLIIWFDKPYNNFIFRINMLNDIIKNNDFILNNDFIFVINNSSILNKINTTFNYNIIKKYNLLMNNEFYMNNTLNETIQKFIKEPFIIFHTKLRLNHDYDYNEIKTHLNMFFSGLKIKKYNIILLGEQKFKSTLESDIHGITTIYPELLKLYNYNSDKILDLTKEYIYNELNYDEYKNDICLINQAEYNICYGQGGQLCSSLLFGKTIFLNPIDINFFFKNMNLYNSGHRYFKRLNMINKYLIEIL